MTKMVAWNYERCLLLSKNPQAEMLEGFLIICPIKNSQIKR